MNEISTNSNGLVKIEEPKLLEKVPEESLWLANFTSDATKTTYQQAVGHFIKFHEISNFNQLREIGAGEIIAWRDYMLKDGIANRTITNRMAALSSLFNHLTEKQKVKMNPLKGLKRPKVDQTHTETPPLSQEQTRLILDSPNLRKFKGVRDRAILSVFAYIGCREAALCKLKVKDFYNLEHYHFLSLQEKGDSKNKVAINHVLRDVLIDYLDQYCQRQLKTDPLSR